MKAAMLTVVALCFCGCNAKVTPPPVGRFQVVAVTATVKRMNGSHDEVNMIVKVDTTTGDAWKYDTSTRYVGSDISKGTIMLDGWTPIPADLTTEVFRGLR